MAEDAKRSTNKPKVPGSTPGAVSPISRSTFTKHPIGIQHVQTAVIQMSTKSSREVIQMSSKSSREVIQKASQSSREVIQKASKSSREVIQKTSKSSRKVIPKVPKIYPWMLNGCDLDE